MQEFGRCDFQNKFSLRVHTFDHRQSINVLNTDHSIENNFPEMLQHTKIISERYMNPAQSG